MAVLFSSSLSRAEVCRGGTDTDTVLLCAGEDGVAPTRTVKKDKTPFTLDFTSDPPLSLKELFAPAAPKSSITTAAAGPARKSATKSADDDFTLPDDFHFNSQNLLRLFLKPKTTVRSRLPLFAHRLCAVRETWH